MVPLTVAIDWLAAVKEVILRGEKMRRGES